MLRAHAPGRAAERPWEADRRIGSYFGPVAGLLPGTLFALDENGRAPAGPWPRWTGTTRPGPVWAYVPGGYGR